MSGSPQMEKEGDIYPEERKYGSESLRLRYSQINSSAVVPQIKQKKVKIKLGSKSSKLKETCRSSMVSLPEKIPIGEIKNISVYHTRY